MNIYEKMSAATERITKVAKNLSIDTGKGKSYKAVSEGDVLAAVKPVERELGIYSYPLKRELVDSGIMTSQTQYGEKKSLYLRVKTTYRFVNTDQPEEYIDVETYGDGVDSQDKAPGKAMTYADKYALLKAYKIQTGDDPDRLPSEDLSGMDKAASPKEKKAFMDMCENLGVDAVEILQSVGWEAGSMTKAQHGLAMAKLIKMSNQ